MATITGAFADHPTLTLEKGNASPISTISAIPLEQGDIAFSVRSQMIFNDELTDAELLQVDGVHSIDSVTSTSLFGALGLSDNLTLGFSLPYVTFNNIREAGHHDDGAAEPAHGHGDGHADGGSDGGEEPGVESLGDSEGLGDARIYGLYRFLGDSDSDLNGALIFGLETPTGRTGERSIEGERLETEHQPGSGSWDPLVGLALTRQFGRLSLDASAVYTFVTEGAQDTDIGNNLAYNLAVSWRALGWVEEGHHDHGGVKNPKAVIDSHHHGPTCDLVLEINGDQREKVEVSGVGDENTGGNVIYASGGARLSFPSGWSAFGSAGVPISRDLNGVQSEPEVRVVFGLSRAF